MRSQRENPKLLKLRAVETMLKKAKIFLTGCSCEYFGRDSMWGCSCVLWRVLRVKAAAALMALVFCGPPALAEQESAQASVSTAKVAAKSESKINDAVPAGLLQIPATSSYYSPYAFLVDKKSRSISVWEQMPDGAGLKEIESFPADMGKQQGEKSVRNDSKTPEGIYFLIESREGAGLDFSLYGKRAFTTDYPNYFDRLVGKTGNGIWLHAVPDHVPLSRGSRGCVVVRNESILKLASYVKLGRTPILIQDQARKLSQQEIDAQRSKVLDWLEEWRKSWEGKDLGIYMAKYASDFRSNHMNKTQWERYKAHLGEVYKSISVRISQPLVFADRNQAVVRFLQKYVSDVKVDAGEKVLYLRAKNDSFEIVGENWFEAPADIVENEIHGKETAATLACQGSNSGGACPASTTH